MFEEILNNKIEFCDLSTKEIYTLINEISNITHIKKLIQMNFIIKYENDLLKKRLDYLINNISSDSLLEKRRKEKMFKLLKLVVHTIDSKLDLLEKLEEIEGEINYV